MTKRRRVKQTISLEQRLADEAKRLREKAKLLKPSPRRDAMLRKAREAETGLHIAEWIQRPATTGVRPPHSAGSDTPASGDPSGPLGAIA